MAVQSHYQQKRTKVEDRNFANNFSQIRNLIAKQSKLGELQRLRGSVIK